MRYSGNRQTGAVGLAVAAPVRITPLARRIAESAGADIRLASGSGRDGKIFSRDLTVPEAVSMAAREGAEASAGVSEGAGAAAGTEVEAGAKKIPMNGMRRVIARRMAKSASETAAVTQYVETDITELVSICDAANKGRGRGERITVTAYILRAMAIAVGEHERFRMRLAEGEKAFILREGVNIGVAVGTDDGLTVPVLRDADGLDVAGISAEVRSMAERARTGMLLPDECRGGVITLSNMGMHGVAAFTPIINQPEASILGIGAPTEKVVPCGDGFAFRSVVTQSLTYDHRIINGTEAAAFQLRIKELLEHPEQLARQAESASGKFNQQ
ncbi:MAG: 2-oxo acid dehydrogenase subunit E2 [Clostridiales Family XIII bacterium]|nr:2-oxo acid dehydrogenase subunit E2 [Clostridiales Family XIII bacterium]